MWSKCAHIKSFSITLALLWLITPPAHAQGVNLQLAEQLKHPMLSWPVSLVAFDVDLKANKLDAVRLSVKDSAGNAVPFQLVQQQGGKTKLYLLTDLPTGSKRDFTVLNATGKSSTQRPVTVKRDGDKLLVSNGKIKVELPAPGTKTPTAPVLRYGTTEWLAKGDISTITGISSMAVSETAAGPLFAAYKIVYQLAGGTYTINLKVTGDMEFLEVADNFRGTGNLPGWKLIWNGLQPDHRHCPNRGVAQGRAPVLFNNVQWEPIAGFPGDTAANAKHPMLVRDQANSPDGELPFHIAAYDNWTSWWRLPTAAFWDTKKNLTAGMFVLNTDDWNDFKYPIGGPKALQDLRFHWKNNVLDYTFPLTAGTRSYAIAIYQHDKDKASIERSRKPLLYVDDLRRWYGWIPLDKVRKWDISGTGDTQHPPVYFKPATLEKSASPAALLRQLENEVRSVATGSERQAGPTPVGVRTYYETIVPMMDAYRSQLTPAQYERARSWYLFMNYVFMDEALMPVRTMLSGHPNFLSDLKGINGLTAFLFPKHPVAAASADEFEKGVRLNFNYHIRPAVPAWNARGGRWTENIATYTWAMLRPNLRASHILYTNFDGKNRILQPGIDKLGDWLVNSLTSPVNAFKNRRVYPPQGAHAHPDTVGLPSEARLFGQSLFYYDPVTAEHLLWATSPADRPFESGRMKTDVWAPMMQGQFAANKGTAPQLQSAKYTGYGAILRSNFGQPTETYVCLQQLDGGPNYRWGRAGGGGIIYYYAAGKRYSDNGPEDSGDGPFGDVERVTNFGIKKPGAYRQLGAYRSVGRNDLSAPLYDLGFAQQATVLAEAAVKADYQSRSIIQTAGDYILIYDKVMGNNTEGRLSWFVSRKDDFPEIFQLKPGVTPKDADIKPSQSGYHKDPPVLPTKGRYYDGKGSFLTLVTHKPGINATTKPYGCQVNLPGNITDWVFRSNAEVKFSEAGLTFQGESGIIRKVDGKYQAVLFEGKAIGVPGMQIQLNNAVATGISLEQTADGFQGKIQNAAPATIILTFKETYGYQLYVGGVPVNGTTIKVATGKHNWQWSNKGVTPDAPVIAGTVDSTASVRVFWNSVNGADSYKLYQSDDNGENWKPAGEVKDSWFKLTGLTNGQKIHLRVSAIGKGGESLPSETYPVYVSAGKPHAPEGLVAIIGAKNINLSWGQILGADSYRLYRKVQGAAAGFKQIYEGSARQFADALPAAGTNYEYAVATVNGNGEGDKSPLIDTDPKRWLNRVPVPGEGFRRDTENHENGFPEYDPDREAEQKILSYPVQY